MLDLRSWLSPVWRNCFSPTHTVAQQWISSCCWKRK
jgi:hypothetical protein